MYLEHFGLNELPFRITPHTDFFFAGANRGATLEALLYAIGHDEGIVKVSGEVGSGKTMLCRVLMERLPAQVDTILLSNPSIAPEEILYAIADELKLDVGDRPTVLLRILQEHLIDLYSQNRRVVVLIDEAHAMPQETLEQIRLLTNLESSRSKLLQIVLFGQPELDEHLNTPKMRQLKERITHSFRLEPLLRSDIEAYLDFRMRAAGYRGPNVFSAAAVRQIVKASKGHTRRVNILADKSLLAAFADNTHGIGAKHVDRAIRDSEFYTAGVSKAKIGLAAGGVAAGLALGLGLHYLLSPPEPSQAAPIAAAATPVAPAPSAAPLQPVTAAAGTPAAPAANEISAVAPLPLQPRTMAAAPGLATPLTAQAAQQTQTKPATLASAASAAPAAPVAVVAPIAAAPVAAAPKREPEPTAASSAKPGSKDYVPPPPATGLLTRARFAATQEWLKSAPGGHYSIQLITASRHDLPRIEELLARAPARGLDPIDFHVYGVKIGDEQHYRLAYGLYATLADVSRGINALPAVYRQFRPFHRSVDRMRSQNRQ